jgi:hypothetical protein
MNWKQHIFKPGWKHKDPVQRREAVSSLHDPELLAALPGICLEDEDPGVQANAAKRITDLAVLEQARKSETDPGSRQVCEQRILSLSASVAPDRPPLQARQAIVAGSADRQLLELVASQAPESELREQALVKITRQGFLGDRAIHDPEPRLRRLAAASITQLSTLRRVIDGTRKTDKELHQSLLGRLHEQLLGAGDPGATRQEALSICQALEEFALQHAGDTSEVPAEISSRWNKISGAAPHDLQNRYQATISRLESSQDIPPAVPEVSTDETVLTEGAESVTGKTHDAGMTVPEDASPGPLPGLFQELEEFVRHSGDKPPARKFHHLQTRWQSAWSGLPAPREQDHALNEAAKSLFAGVEKAIESARQQKEKAFEQAAELLARFEQELEDGALHKALETRHKLTELGKALRSDKRWKVLNRQVSSLHGRVRELRDWHHWSNDKIRKQLIREMEILPATDLHPDAILDRVKSLQKQWKELEKSEQIPGDSHYHAAPWMWRKFSAAGHKAFAATKPFLEKRDEIRDRHLETLQDLCTRLNEAAAAEDPDPANLSNLLRKTRKELRDLDQVPHKTRRKIASRMRAALERGNAAMQARYELVEKHKLKLIRAASQLSHVEDMNEAIREAKRLQAEWKKAGSLWRSRENELWQTFREPLDPLFSKLKSTQESEREEYRERRETQESLCKNLQEILSGGDGKLQAAQGKVQGLKDAWRDIEHPDRSLQKRFQDLAETFDQRVLAYRRTEAEKVHQAWWHKSKLLHELETALLEGAADETTIKKAVKDWPQQDSSEAIDKQLDERFSSLVASRSVDQPVRETAIRAAELSIQLEFLAGLPSPKAEKDQRMKYQVDRLSKSLSGDSERLPAAQEARSAEQEWLTLPLLKARDHTRFERRIKKALKELYRTNSV